eukprot:scaffold9856_cov129-Skeletonema_marinoi.AAC.1
MIYILCPLLNYRSQAQASKLKYAKTTEKHGMGREPKTSNNQESSGKIEKESCKFRWKFTVLRSRVIIFFVCEESE